MSFIIAASWTGEGAEDRGQGAAELGDPDGHQDPGLVEDDDGPEKTRSVPEEEEAEPERAGDEEGFDHPEMNHRQTSELFNCLSI